MNLKQALAAILLLCCAHAALADDWMIFDRDLAPLLGNYALIGGDAACKSYRHLEIGDGCDGKVAWSCVKGHNISIKTNGAVIMLNSMGFPTQPTGWVSDSGINWGFFKTDDGAITEAFDYGFASEWYSLRKAGPNLQVFFGRKSVGPNGAVTMKEASNCLFQPLANGAQSGVASGAVAEGGPKTAQTAPPPAAARPGSPSHEARPL